MAKQQRGSSRTPNRSVTPASSSGKPSSSARPSSGRPTGSGQRSGNSSWQPNKVSGGKRGTGPNRTLLFTIGAVVVGVLIVAFVAWKQLGSTPANGANDPIITPGHVTLATIPTDGRTLGQASAPVTIDLYGDFRCSQCYTFTVGGTAEQINSQLVATGKAKIVWHDYTVIDLNQKNNASRDAANAAMCAADQGKFWVMHDWLYANQSPAELPDAFSLDRLVKIGQAAGLDMAKFEPCVRNGTHNAEIAAEQTKLPGNVTGTPALLIGGQLLTPSIDAVTKAVDAATHGSASPAPSAS
jgi:protein-disulfide isomerase